MRTKSERRRLHQSTLATKRQIRRTNGSNRTDVVLDSAKQKMYLKVRVDGQELFTQVKPEKE
tara:strand:+ start:10836 stop:11021 length:186 start_codon:yes stop_codon:yes gene_type:complete